MELNKSQKWYPVQTSRQQQEIIGSLGYNAEGRVGGGLLIVKMTQRDTVRIEAEAGRVSILMNNGKYATIDDAVVEGFQGRLDAEAAAKKAAKEAEETPRQAALRRMRNKKRAERRRLREQKE